MNASQSPANNDPRRKAIRRTVMILIACALTSYGVFLFSVLSSK
ncbi:hypothetical protein [Arenimonas oryziterrae]|uniref:Uncharacterized protein n=1 Tax=Arenimonas oryziterrae DSM 21050 = YC6267 TaxID=1121015 RepID=A0A091AVP6_9GAMM|nr:hypothetical protein [Arenimonas oryziterrae]KFN43476.1 hypothetical protein N789_09380 [Arenimonas oryziterrae DSM 21050 = YC6267]